MSSPIAVVTGASSGIGASIATCFLEAGYQVVNLDLRQPTASHGGMETWLTDLGDRDATRAVAADIASRHAVTTLVHNAGVIRPARLEDVDLADLDQLAQLHLGSAISLAQAFLPAMKAAQFGRIVLIGSRAALGLQTRTLYAATKSGLSAIARTWGLELGAHGITVNCVAPGPIAGTDMFHATIADGSEQMQRMAASIPVRRLGRPADVARAVMFLADPRSGFITGQTLMVCGGASLGSLSL